ncbi:FAD dependent oxidoreductase [Truncatella angustata]|uniref:FAD dependent oxidoreductase n=1 Tax=Truncatella angustata TaxID=152316 RepID=A0A9P8RKT6_9PEZI|nr:FAD dependent oxidoreductase [Truncatella angustata]KAH6647891.1 FAD dependent oxidoreductase [Truncatella angustata]
MEQRAAIPVTLPRANPTSSYWQTPPDDVADLRSTMGLPEKAEIVIIGSGITGASLAYNLLQYGRQDIVMLEARQASSGATGRNGGNTKAASYRSFLQHAEEHGTETAVKIAKLELSNIREMHAFARAHAIDCDSHPCETIDVFYDEAQWKESERAIQAMKKAMPDHPASVYKILTAEEVRAEFYCGNGGTENIYGGIVYEAGSIHAYKLSIGILKLCLEQGLNLQTNTPAMSLQRLADGRWKVQTPRGDIIAQQVVLATNGYTAHLVNKFQGTIVPYRGHVTAQRPGQAMPKEGLPVTYSYRYNGGYEYMVSRPQGSHFEGDIVIGGGQFKAPGGGILEYGTTDDTTVNEDIDAILYECLPQYFGDYWGEDHPGGRIRSIWTGIMGYSADGFPFVGEVPEEKNLWMSCSFQGHGMVLCWMCARMLALLIEGGDNAELQASFPEVFRASQQRMGATFRGRLHVSADPTN